MACFTVQHITTNEEPQAIRRRLDVFWVGVSFGPTLLWADDAERISADMSNRPELENWWRKLLKRN